MIWRIRERAAFDRIGRTGHRIRVATNPDRSRTPSSMSVWCTFLPDAAATPPRVAYAIGRAVGSAVDRNRLRRRCRALLDERAASMPAGWYLFGARPGATELTFDALADEVDALLAGARRLAASSLVESSAASPPTTVTA